MRGALSLTHSLTATTMPANPSSLLILHPRLNVYLKPFVLSLPHFSSPNLSLNRARRFPIPRHPFPISPTRNLSSLSSTSVAQCSGENGGGGGRSGALSPPPITDVVQKIDVNPPKGTRDFAPEEMRLRSWLFQNFREVRVSKHVYIYGCMHEGLYLIGCGIQVSRIFGFEEVDFPVLESEALFIRKAGEEIRDQVSLSYIFFFFLFHSL